MSKNIYKFEDVIGQTINKNIIINQLKTDTLSKFMFFYGDSGSGKSTMAELVAMAATCTSGNINPCLCCERCHDNMEALHSSGVSRNIKKINIGKLINKNDIRDMIKEIFDLQPLPGEKTFYILEEVHLLGKNQDMLLEELERMNEDTHIIMCTTNYSDILDTLKTRAQLKLNFKRLTPSECRILIDKLCASLGINGLSAADKSFLAHAANCNAREITNFLETFRSEVDYASLLREYFSKIDTLVYLQLVEALFKDFPSFIVYISELEATQNLVDIWKSFHEFIRNVVFYLYGGGVTLFNNYEKGQINKLFGRIPTDKITQLYKLSNKSVRSQMDAEYNLITIREVMNDIHYTSETVVKEATIENNIATKNASLKANKNTQMKIPTLDITGLNNMTTNNFTYDIKADF